MCNPASIVITKDYKCWWSPETSESHSDIIEKFELYEDGSKGPNVVKVEITPPDNDFAAPLDQWLFKVDPDILPDWWDAEKGEAAARKELPNWLVKKVVLPGQERAVKACEYIIAYGNSTVKAYGNSTVKASGNSTVEASGNSTVKAYDNSTVEAYDNSTVKAYDNSTVEAYSNSTATRANFSNAKLTSAGNDVVIIDRTQSPPVCHVGKGTI